MKESIVQVQGLSKCFPSAPKPALKDINLDIEAGKFTGIVGADGAGKTTLMRLLAGLLLPDAGTITIDSRDRFKDSESLTHDISYMPQRFGLYEDLSLQENLNLYAKLQGLDVNTQKTQSEKLLSLTNLLPFKKRLAGALSGGMKQKLGLACALMKMPKLLLLDEPSVGVDPISRRELWALVAEFIAQGMTVIWSTSYLDEAEKCSRVLLLNEGEVIFHGEPYDLSQEVKDRTFTLSGSSNKRILLSQLEENPLMLDGNIQGDKVHVMLRDEQAINEFKHQITIPNLHIEQVEPKFEDGFINRLGGTSGLSKLSKTVPEISVDIDDVICCKQLTKQFGNFKATDNMTLNIKKGEVFGFLGPNGAGKSTTFKMLCGLLKPSSGEIKVMGMDLIQSPSIVRQKIGYMAQKFSLYEALTVLQNLYFFSGVYGLRKKQRENIIHEVIEIFKLESILAYKTASLSLGFKQRLALACAIMHRPAILFLDEPTSGVDPITRREFWGHISALTMKGVTIMVTTHFMEEAEYCDRIALVYRGKMIAQDTPDNLKAQCSTTEYKATLEDTFITLIQNYEQETAA
tara:strand:- start:743 stop:2464 length:1722 start_codon:yes stop_codon:yes gene_type:complete